MHSSITIFNTTGSTTTTSTAGCLVECYVLSHGRKDEETRAIWAMLPQCRPCVHAVPTTTVASTRTVDCTICRFMLPQAFAATPSCAGCPPPTTTRAAIRRAAETTRSPEVPGKPALSLRSASRVRAAPNVPVLEPEPGDQPGAPVGYYRSGFETTEPTVGVSWNQQNLAFTFRRVKVGGDVTNTEPSLVTHLVAKDLSSNIGLEWKFSREGTEFTSDDFFAASAEDQAKMMAEIEGALSALELEVFSYSLEVPTEDCFAMMRKGPKALESRPECLTSTGTRVLTWFEYLYSATVWSRMPRSDGCCDTSGTASLLICRPVG